MNVISTSLEAMLRELGVPDETTPAPIANVVEMIEALKSKVDAQERELYLAHCAQCGETDELVMVAHRRDFGMIGVLFSCKDCFDDIAGAEIEIEPTG